MTIIDNTEDADIQILQNEDFTNTVDNVFDNFQSKQLEDTMKDNEEQKIEKNQVQNDTYNDNEQKQTSNAIVAIPTIKNSLSQYLLNVSKIPSLTAEEEFAFAISYIEKCDRKAAHKLILSHLKLVVKIAFTYKNYNIPTIDMISEGNLGLLRAVSKFNPKLGFRLSTYAIWWIKAAIQEYILKSWSAVKTVTTKEQKKLFLALRKLRKQIINVHISNHPEEYKKIAEDLNISVKEVIDMEDRMLSPDISLNKNISSDNQELKTELIDTIPTKHTTQETELIEYQDKNRQKKLLEEALTKLQPRELEIFQSRNFNEKPVTLEKLSIKFEISKERVRQIEVKAIEKIKKYVSEKY